MKMIGRLCFILVLLMAIPQSPVWARGGWGHSHGGGLGLGLTLGVLGGWGLGYYARPYGAFYGYPPAFGYGGFGGYGYAPYGYAPYGYGYGAGYGYPPAAVVPSAPQVIVQQQPQAVQAPPPPAPAANYWYYCRKPDGYYPYIKNCPDGWLQVSPQPVQ